MIIVLLLVVLWGVVLGPSIYRKIRNSDSDRSIMSFHKSLNLLERSGPKVVEPAYRLSGGENPLPPPQIAVPQNPPTIAQPRLVLLGPISQGGENKMRQQYEDYYEEDRSTQMGDRRGAYESEHYEDDEYANDSYLGDDDRISYGASGPSTSLSRREAALRRRNILFSLIAAVLLSAIIGVIVSVFFYVTILAIIALVGYVGLMAYAATNGFIGEKGYDRHVAHGVAHLEDDRFEEDDGRHRVASSRGSEDLYFDDDLDGDDWWEEPQRAAAR